MSTDDQTILILFWWEDIETGRGLELCWAGWRQMGVISKPLRAVEMELTDSCS